MNELYHYYGGDLQLDNTGDLAQVTGQSADDQRIIRRLLTATDGYLFQEGYGGGLGERVGGAADTGGIKALVVAQMSLETSVANNPAPVVTLVPKSGNTFVCTIQYVDAVTQQSQTLTFPVE